MANNNFRIASNDRLLITGVTGGGKSFLARHLLKRVKRAVMLYPKGDITPEEVGGELPTRDSRHKLNAGEAVRIVYTPDRKEENDNRWLEAFELAYDAGDCVVYVDEMYLVVEPSARPPQILTAIATTGRTAGVGLWTVTQRPVWIPIFCMSEATHFFCFYLNMLEDRKRMSNFMGEEVITPVGDKHGFYYFSILERQVRYFNKLEVAK